ncbi:outer membrane protein assembly factor BamE domain-containing protein [Pseudomonas citronellolis]|uniref:outer membrane protein assembly factor BamE domain-containing protein n=1 Tax=Pseudomonas citronellolis TaxID=53408 RepID=UPI002FDAE5A6
MNKTKSILAAALLVAGGLFGTGATAVGIIHSNPVDEISNPNALDYTDVHVDNPDFKAPFVRDGVVSEPQRFQAVRPGVTQAQIQSALGAPLKQQQGPHGVEWEYNFKLRMASSQNFLVCQYKVLFDEQHLVREAVWRRRQCQQLAAGEVAAK